jgi:hypothetical protein
MPCNLFVMVDASVSLPSYNVVKGALLLGTYQFESVKENMHL